jgi:hypothetical protein
MPWNAAPSSRRNFKLHYSLVGPTFHLTFYNGVNYVWVPIDDAHIRTCPGYGPGVQTDPQLVQKILQWWNHIARRTFLANYTSRTITTPPLNIEIIFDV